MPDRIRSTLGHLEPLFGSSHRLSHRRNRLYAENLPDAHNKSLTR